ncbi:nuclear receptor coactivator 5-like [Tubulanus polymorphus]|uniref:nuclear receptor coactivator 5-like n=1 Tax=Tubulanus polymorphus TaxID=672921 RepID=UPI003DA46BC4
MPSRSRSRSPKGSDRRRSPGSPDRRRSRSTSRRSRSRSPNKIFKRRSDSPMHRRRSPIPLALRKNFTNSSDPELMKSRVFAANLPTNSNQMTREAFENWFAKHGEIVGVSLHKSYGFIQFKNEEDAKRAVEAENGSLYHGYRMDVKMAMDGRRQPYRPSSPGLLRERSPLRGPPRDPYRDERMTPDVYRRAPVDDPYRRPPMNDPYRRDTYGMTTAQDVYRDSYPAPTGQANPPVDTMIYITDRLLRPYGDLLDKRLKSIGMMVGCVVLTADMSPKGALESCMRRGILYVIFANEQNELHRSITLNILIGTPQEHRNMPLDDAMNLVARNFEKYIQQSREKPGSRPGDILPPEPDVAYLLNLLADGRHLAMEELDKVRDFIAERRSTLLKEMEQNKKAATPPKEDLKQQQAQLQAKILSILNPGTPLPQPESEVKPKPTISSPLSSGPMAPQLQAPVSQSSGALLQSPQFQMPVYSMQSSTPQQEMMPQYQQAHRLTPSPQQPKIPTTQLNLDNPNIQKALNNLIQSGPDLIRNIASSVSSSQQQQQQQAQDLSVQMQMRSARMMGPGMVRGQAPPPPPGPPGPNAMRSMVPY